MPLIKNGEIAENPWTHVGTDDAVPDQGPVIVTYERWQRDRDSLLQRDDPVGIMLQSDEAPALIADDLDRFELVALAFPVFRDGRPFSYARLLRDWYDFTGELRAIGHILPDQFLFLVRSGLDSVEVGGDAEKTLASWQKAMSEISVFYQGTGDARSTVLGLRHGS